MLISSGSAVAIFHKLLRKVLLAKIDLLKLYISINVNKCSKVNCTLNRVYEIHDVLSLYPLSSEERD